MTSPLLKYLLPALLLYTSSGYLQAQERTKPNVLFIVVDDLRPNLGCYGDVKAITPNIDKLARSGTLFNNAYCQQAVCNPSRASVLTGLSPDENGVTDLVTHFREKVPNVVTLPQAFKNAGYTSVGVGKIFHGTKNTMDAVSWSDDEMKTLPKKSGEYTLAKNRTGGKAAALEFVEGPDNRYPDGKMVETSIGLLRKFKKSGEPFFLATGFTKPHLPFCAPKKYWDLYQQKDFSEIPNKNRPLNSPAIAYHEWQELRGYTDIPDQGPITAQQQQELIRGYYACISYLDEQIGKLTEELDRSGLRQNTIIVLWGDHGYHLGEQDLWCKSTNFELDTRIPLMIVTPGITQVPAKTDAIVEAVDIYPTLTDICGINPDTKLSGKSLKPLLQEPRTKWDHVAYSQFCRPYKAITAKNPSHMGYTVRDKDFRYTAWYNLSTGVVEQRELYDLKKNNTEVENVAGAKKYKRTEQRLSDLLDAYRRNN